jgi:hypothetical protein
VSGAVAVRSWFARVFIALLVAYCAWWVGELDRLFLNFLKIVMEPLLPAVFGEIRSVMHSVDGGWRIVTALRPISHSFDDVSFGVDEIFLLKSIVWVPAALALVTSSARFKIRPLGMGVGLVLLGSISVLITCIAAHLAVLVNNTPAALDDDILPLPPGVELNVEAYPNWYFHLVTFANYLGMLAAPLGMPVVIWLIVCRREIRDMLFSKTA